MPIQYLGKYEDAGGVEYLGKYKETPDLPTPEPVNRLPSGVSFSNSNVFGNNSSRAAEKPKSTSPIAVPENADFMESVKQSAYSSAFRSKSGIGKRMPAGKTIQWNDDHQPNEDDESAWKELVPGLKKQYPGVDHNKSKLHFDKLRKFYRLAAQVYGDAPLVDGKRVHLPSRANEISILPGSGRNSGEAGLADVEHVAKSVPKEDRSLFLQAVNDYGVNRDKSLEGTFASKANTRLDRGMASVGESLSNLSSMVFGDEKANDEAMFRTQIRQATRTNLPATGEGLIAQGVLGATEMVPSLAGAAAATYLSGGAAAVAAGAAGASTAGAAAAAGAAGTAGATAYWTAQMAPGLYHDLKGMGIDDTKAKMVAVAGAIPMAAIETMQFKGITNAGREAVKRVAAESITDAIAQTAKAAGKEYAKNLGEEGLQAAVESGTKAVAMALDGQSDGLGQEWLKNEAAGWGRQVVEAAKSLPFLMTLGVGGNARANIKGIQKPYSIPTTDDKIAEWVDANPDVAKKMATAVTIGDPITQSMMSDGRLRRGNADERKAFGESVEKYLRSKEPVQKENSDGKQAEKNLQPDVGGEVRPSEQADEVQQGQEKEVADANQTEVPSAKPNPVDETPKAAPVISSNAIIQSVSEASPELVNRYAASAGVKEGFTIGDHSARVVDNVMKTLDPADVDALGKRTGMRIPEVMQYAAALHDVGKFDAIAAGDKGRQHEFTGPIVDRALQRFAAVENVPFTEQERKAIRLLSTTDPIGKLIQGKISARDAASQIENAAKQAGISPQDFLLMQSAFYKADAGDYPELKKNIFRRRQNGKDALHSVEYAALEELIYGEVREIPWMERFDGQAQDAGNGRSDRLGLRLVHGTAINFDQFDAAKDRGTNAVGPGVYLLAKEDHDVADHYGDRAMRMTLGMFSKASQAKLKSNPSPEFLQQSIDKVGKQLAYLNATNQVDKAAEFQRGLEVLQGMLDGKVGKRTIEVDFDPKKTLVLGSIENGGHALSKADRDEILSKLNPQQRESVDSILQAAPEKLRDRGGVLYSAMAKALGSKAAVNELLMSAGYDSIQFLHGKGNYSRPYNVLVALEHQKAEIVGANRNKSIADVVAQNAENQSGGDENKAVEPVAQQDQASPLPPAEQKQVEPAKPEAPAKRPLPPEIAGLSDEELADLLQIMGAVKRNPLAKKRGKPTREELEDMARVAVFGEKAPQITRFEKPEPLSNDSIAPEPLVEREASPPEPLAEESGSKVESAEPASNATPVPLQAEPKKPEPLYREKKRKAPLKDIQKPSYEAADALAEFDAKAMYDRIPNLKNRGREGRLKKSLMYEMSIDKERVPLLEAAKREQRRNSAILAAENRRNRDELRSDMHKEIDAGNINRQNVSYAPTSHLPGKIARLVRKEADILYTAMENKESADAKSLDRIRRGVDKPVAADEDQRERIFQRLVEGNRQLQEVQNRQEAPRPRDFEAQAFFMSPEKLKEEFETSIRQLEAFGKKSPLVEMAYRLADAELNPDGESFSLDDAVIHPSNEQVIRKIEDIAKEYGVELPKRLGELQAEEDAESDVSFDFGANVKEPPIAQQEEFQLEQEPFSKAVPPTSENSEGEQKRMFAGMDSLPGQENLFETDGTTRYSLKKLNRRPLTFRDIVRAFPGADAIRHPVEKDAIRITLPNGLKIDVRQQDFIKVDLKQAEKGLGRKLSDEDKSQLAAAGSFTVTLQSGVNVDAVGVMRLAKVGADADILRHERFHVGHMLGLVSPAEFKALVKQFSSADRSQVQQEEDIANAAGSVSFMRQISRGLRRVLRSLGFGRLLGKNGDDVLAAMDSGNFWLRQPGTMFDGTMYATVQGSKSVKKHTPEYVASLANPGIKKGVRDAIDEQRLGREDQPRRSDEEVLDEAEQRFRTNQQGETDNLIEAGLHGGLLNDKDVRVARMVLNSLGDDPASPEFIAALDAYDRAASEAGRAFRQLRDDIESPEQRNFRLLNTAITKPSDKIQAKINLERKNAAQENRAPNVKPLYEEAADEAKEVMQKIGITPDQLKKAAGDKKKTVAIIQQVQSVRAPFADKMFEYWVASVLSGIPTQVRNFVGTAGHAAWYFSVQKLVDAALVSPVLRQFGYQGGARMGEFAPVVTSMAKSLSEAAKNFRETWATEIDQFEEAMSGNHQTQFFPEQAKVAIGGKKGRVIRSFLTGMRAIDAFNKTVIAHGIAAERAYRIASDEGLSGKAFDSRVDDLIQHKDSPVWNAAYDEAKRLALQQEGGAGAKATKEVLNKIKEKIPFARYLLTFSTAMVNIFEAGFKMSPLGTLSLANRVRKGDTKNITADFAQQLIALSGFLMIHGQDEDDPWITGSDGFDGEHRYSVRLGDTWVYYGWLEPFATAMGMTVDTSRAMKLPNKMQIIPKLIDAIRSQIEEKTFSSSLGDISKALRSKTGFVEKMAEWSSKFAISWVPNLSRSVGREMDDFVPNRRVRGDDTAEFAERMGKRFVQNLELGLQDVIPGMEDLPRYDIFGEVLKKSEVPAESISDLPDTDLLWRLLSPVATTKDQPFVGRAFLAAWKNKHPEDVDKLRYPPDPVYTVDGKDVSMTDEQEAQFHYFSGRVARKLVEAGNYDPKNPTREQFQSLQDDLSDAHRVAKELLVDEWLGGKKATLDSDAVGKALAAKKKRDALDFIRRVQSNPQRRLRRVGETLVDYQQRQAQDKRQLEASREVFKRMSQKGTAP